MFILLSNLSTLIVPDDGYSREYTIFDIYVFITTDIFYLSPLSETPENACRTIYEISHSLDLVFDISNIIFVKNSLER
jgi:hypothetical protein